MTPLARGDILWKKMRPREIRDRLDTRRSMAAKRYDYDFLDLMSR